MNTPGFSLLLAKIYTNREENSPRMGQIKRIFTDFILYPGDPCSSFACSQAGLWL
jgi:hypothetical protein